MPSLYKLGIWIEKGKALIPKLAPAGVCPVELMIRLCHAGVYRRMFAEVDGWLQQLVCFDILEQ